MIIEEQVKAYQDCRKQFDYVNESIKDSAIEFYKNISVASSLLQEIPDELIYRKMHLQNLISSIIQCVDDLSDEINLLSNDCTLQIHRLVSYKQLNELKNNKKI